MTDEEKMLWEAIEELQDEVKLLRTLLSLLIPEEEGDES